MDDQTEGSSVSDQPIQDLLQLQLSEVEMLSSMFPNPEEFKLDNQCACASIQAFIDGTIKYEYLQKRIGFSVTLHLDKVTVEVVCQLPHEYPAVSPQVFTRCPQMNRKTHQRLNEDLHEYITNLERGEICMVLVVEWIQENVHQYVKTEDIAIAGDGSKDQREEDTVFTRLWIYSHHIYSKFKRRDIIDFAEELKLTGFSLPGKPGVICVEGYSRPTEEYWQRLRRQNWKRLVIKEKEEKDIGDDCLSKYRKFQNFEEKVFDVRGGKGREYHMDLGKLCEFLQEHDCARIFSVFFGVEGKVSGTSE